MVLRAIEEPDGWRCRHGDVIYDAHQGLDEALDHLTQIAEASRPAQVMVHWMDGAVQTVRTLG